MKYFETCFLILFIYLTISFKAYGSSEDNLSPQISVDAKLQNEIFFLEFKNISKRPVILGPVYFSDSSESGFWVFIYDVKEKKIEQGYALSNPLFGEERENKYDRKVLPSEGISISLKKSDVLAYFSEIPRCYYVIFLYRKKVGVNLIYSRSSAPILQCVDKGIYDPPQ